MASKQKAVMPNKHRAGVGVVPSDTTTVDTIDTEDGQAILTEDGQELILE